ncbi:hypothetical protein WN943_016068 [Citrus x changshan-huyou]
MALLNVFLGLFLLALANIPKTALGSYPEFGRTDTKREVAAFFAHVNHETTDFCSIEERDKTNPYCTPKPQYPCANGKFYYGRGLIQLTGNGNNMDAGNAIGFDGLNSPETVARDRVISFKTALWYWMRYAHSTVKQGFGETIWKINGAAECGGQNREQVQDRVRRYTDYCKRFDVDPGPNLEC